MQSNEKNCLISQNLNKSRVERGNFIAFSGVKKKYHNDINNDQNNIYISYVLDHETVMILHLSKMPRCYPDSCPQIQ